MRLTGSSANNNELLDYIQSLGKDAELLTNSASQEVLDSMTAFIDRCMGERPPLLECCKLLLHSSSASRCSGSSELSDLQAIQGYKDCSSTF